MQFLFTDTAQPSPVRRFTYLGLWAFWMPGVFSQAYQARHKIITVTDVPEAETLAVRGRTRWKKVHGKYIGKYTVHIDVHRTMSNASLLFNVFFVHRRVYGGCQKRAKRTNEHIVVLLEQ